METMKDMISKYSDRLKALVTVESLILLSLKDSVSSIAVKELTISTSQSLTHRLQNQWKNALYRML